MDAVYIYRILLLLPFSGTDQSVLLLKGFNDQINTTAGSSVWLPTSYTVHREKWSGFSPSFKWLLNGGLFLFFSGENCSLSPEGFFYNCSGKPYLLTKKDNQVSFFSENASVILHNVQLQDSGSYALESRHAKDKVVVRLLVFANDAAGQSSLLNFILMTAFIPATKVTFTTLFLYYTYWRTVRYKRHYQESQ